MRIDLYLSENGYASSRTEAKGFVVGGAVSVNGEVVTKPSFDVPAGAEVSVIKEFKKYVSRGGYKLEAALDSFNVSCEGRLALDIGASCGGFTDCLLKRGAKHVIAVDSGSMQIVESLRADERVTVVEGYNARYMSPGDLEYTPDLVVMDVSFISATLIMPSIKSCLAERGDFICLIKPQFEVGRAGIGKGGIVKDEKLRDGAVSGVVSFAERLGFKTCGIIRSPIEGGDGNVEFLAHFKV